MFATVKLRINPLEANNERSWFYDFWTTKSAETTKTNTLDLGWFGSALYKFETITTVNLHINPLEAKTLNSDFCISRWSKVQNVQKKYWS